jgi:hypothetical protein
MLEVRLRHGAQGLLAVPLPVVAVLWVVALTLRPLPLLIRALTHPDDVQLLEGWVTPGLAALTAVAVLASIWWGGRLAVVDHQATAIGSVVVAIVITICWGYLMAAVWDERAEISPEAGWALLSVAVVLTAVAAGLAILVGYVVLPRIAAPEEVIDLTEPEPARLVGRW